MPPRPATVVGVGIDAVDVARFRQLLARRPAIVHRVFTDAERADAERSADPAERLAARFAAKEATMKALGTGIGAFAFRDVEVVSAAGRGAEARAPKLVLSAGAAELAGRRAVGRWHLSLTHSGGLAMALVVAEATG